MPYTVLRLQLFRENLFSTGNTNVLQIDGLKSWIRKVLGTCWPSVDLTNPSIVFQTLIRFCSKCSENVRIDIGYRSPIAKKRFLGPVLTFTYKQLSSLSFITAILWINFYASDVNFYKISLKKSKMKTCQEKNSPKEYFFRDKKSITHIISHVLRTNWKKSNGGMK